MEVKVVGRGEGAQAAGWLALSDLLLVQLREDASRRFLQDRDDPPRALRHVMNVVLFKHLVEMRRAVRCKLLTEDRARAAMASSFAQGYRAGLVASYALGCGLPPEGPEAQAALRDVLGYVFGKAADAQPARLSGPATGRFAAGKATAMEDLATFRAWLADAAAEAASFSDQAPPGPRKNLQ